MSNSLKGADVSVSHTDDTTVITIDAGFGSKARRLAIDKRLLESFLKDYIKTDERLQTLMRKYSLAPNVAHWMIRSSEAGIAAQERRRALQANQVREREQRKREQRDSVAAIRHAEQMRALNQIALILQAIRERL